MLVCANKMRNSQANGDQFHPTPAKTASMFLVCHDYTHPCPPIVPFLPAQNLFQNKLYQLIICIQSHLYM